MYTVHLFTSQINDSLSIVSVVQFTQRVQNILFTREILFQREYYPQRAAEGNAIVASFSFVT